MTENEPQTILLQDFNAQFGFGIFVVTGEHQRTAFFSKEKAEQYLAQQHDQERFRIVVYPKPVAELREEVLLRRIRMLEGDLRQINTLYINALDKLNKAEVSEEGERISISKEHFNRLCQFLATAKHAAQAYERQPRCSEMNGTGAWQCELEKGHSGVHYYRTPEWTRMK